MPKHTISSSKVTNYIVQMGETEKNSLYNNPGCNFSFILLSKKSSSYAHHHPSIHQLVCMVGCMVMVF